MLPKKKKFIYKGEKQLFLLVNTRFSPFSILYSLISRIFLNIKDYLEKNYS